MSTLRLTCPHCGEDLDALQCLAEGELREYLACLAGLGEARVEARAYIELFRARPGATLGVGRRLRLAQGLKRLWDGQVFRLARQSHTVTHEQIRAALADVLRAAPTGLQNHNYLLRVLASRAGVAEREERKTAGRAERRDEAARAAAAARRPASRPETLAADERPIWERGPAEMALALAQLYRSPTAARALAETRQRLEEALSRAGLDLARLRELAPALPSLLPESLGAELMRKCKRKGGPAPVGECLPGMEASHEGE